VGKHTVGEVRTDEQRPDCEGQVSWNAPFFSEDATWGYKGSEKPDMKTTMLWLASGDKQTKLKD